MVRDRREWLKTVLVATVQGGINTSEEEEKE